MNETKHAAGNVTTSQAGPTMKIRMLRDAAGSTPPGDSFWRRGRALELDEPTARGLIAAGAAYPQTDEFGDMIERANPQGLPLVTVPIRLFDPPPGCCRDINIARDVADLMIAAHSADVIRG